MPLNRDRVWENIGYWLAEIVVVFIGVYLAFWLNGYRIKTQQKHKKQQIYTALYKHFKQFHFKKSGKTFLDSVYAEPFLNAYRKKKMPRLKPLPFYKSNLSSQAWLAMLQAGGLSLLNTNFILQLNNFYSNNRYRTKIMQHMNRMNDKYLLPYTDADISRFYNTKTKQVRPLYNWYVRFLEVDPELQKLIRKQYFQIMDTLKQKMNQKQLQKVQADSTG